MSKKKKLFEKLMAGNADESFSFQDFALVAQHLGYEFVRKSGSHRIFEKEGFPLLIAQPRKDGKAKAYQIKQMRDEIKKGIT